MFVSFSDSLELASKLTFIRLINAIKIYLSYWFSRLTGKASIKGYPISFAIEPTTACNLRCPECPSGLRSFTRPTGKLKTDFFKDIINQLAPFTTYLTFYFQGEPYLNPELLRMIAYANEKKIYTATSTNAHFLHMNAARETVLSGLKRLIISIDGLTQTTYESYRKEGSLEKVLAGTQNIIQAKKEMNSRFPIVIWQFLVVRPNEHEIEQLYKLAEEYEVDKVALKTAQVYDYEYGNALIPENDKYSRYKKQKNGTYKIKNGISNHCWKMWSSCVITWDGKVVPCCFDKDAKHQLGDISQYEFKKVWNSKDYNRFRQKLLKGRKEIDICQNCTEGTKVWA